MYKLVIFDLDGTLANTLDSMAMAGNKTLEDCGFLPRDVEEYKYFVGNGADNLVRRALRAAGDEENIHFEEAKKLYAKYFKEYCNYNVRLYDGIKETLDWLKEHGISIAILTNKPHDRAITVVEQLFGEGYIDKIIGQQEGIKIKPSPEGVFLLTNYFSVTPEECVYVGDSDVDMQTGNNAGTYTVGVMWGFRTKEELERNKAHKVISNPKELCELFQKRD